MRSATRLLLILIVFSVLQVSSALAQEAGGMLPGEPMCFDPTRGEIPCSEMPGADPNMPPPGNSCASIPDPANRAECEKHIHTPSTSGMPPMGSH